MPFALHPSPLWRAVGALAPRTLAVMGLAKNTGKTVTLNHLLAQAAGQRLAVGLTSIGRDGEERDAVFAIPKPPVRVWPGTVVATARATLARAGVRTRWLAGTGVASPMGEIVLVKVLDAGTMEVAGASRGPDQRRVIDALHDCGATMVLLDGALGRSQHASPAIADAVVLATGAAVGGALPDVLRKTRERLALLRLAPADHRALRHCAGLFEQGQGVGLWDAQGRALFSEPAATLTAGPSLLAASEQVARAAGRVACVACTGAVGRSLWQAFEQLAEAHPGLQVLVADGTRLFVEPSDLASLARRGAHLAAWRPIRIAGLTTNPFSPQGGHLVAADLLAGAREAFPDLTIADVMLESTDLPAGALRHADHKEPTDGPLAA